MTQPSALAQAESLLLTPFSLTEGDLSRTFGQIDLGTYAREAAEHFCPWNS